MIDIALPTNDKELKAATDEAIKAIEKDHGAGAIAKMGTAVTKQMPHIPTGIYSLDKDVLGIGGLPMGRILELYGVESGGKTTLALSCIAAVQRAGKQAAFIDAEYSLDPRWAKTNGVDVDNLFVSQPECGEEALQIVEALLQSGAFGIIVVDSVAALVPRSELEGDIGDSSMGVQARMMSQAMRKLTGLVSKSNTILIFINQIRMKIGITFGNPETTTGGRALQFYASVRLDIRKISTIKNGDIPIGNKVRIKAPKNKVGRPYGECEVDLMFDSGFDTVAPVIEAAVEAGIVVKAGSWFSYKGEKIGQGKDNVALYVKQHNLLDEITRAIGEKNNAAVVS